MTDWLERAIALLDSAIEDHAASPANPEECGHCYSEYYPCRTNRKITRSLTILRTLREVWIAGTSGEKHV